MTSKETLRATLDLEANVARTSPAVDNGLSNNEIT
jgi:hypothetical protein